MPQMVLKIMVMPFRFILLDPLPCKKLSISWLYSSFCMFSILHVHKTIDFSLNTHYFTISCGLFIHGGKCNKTYNFNRSYNSARLVLVIKNKVVDSWKRFSLKLTTMLLRLQRRKMTLIFPRQLYQHFQNC